MRNILTIIFLLSVHLVYGQSYADLLKLNYLGSSSSTFDSSTGRTRIYEANADLTAPIPIKKNTTILTGLLYEKFTSKLFENAEYSDVSSLGLKIGFSQDHRNNWNGTYMFIPRIASDGMGRRSDGFQPGGVVMLKKTVTPHKAFRVGLYFNSENLGPFFVPLFGLYHLSRDKKFEISITAPVAADFNYALHKRINAGIDFRGQMRTFRLNDLNGTTNNGYLMRSSSEVSTYVRFNVTQSWLLFGKTGYSIGRYHRVYSGEDKVVFGMPLIYPGDDRVQLNQDFNDGLLFQVSVVYRYHFKVSDQ